MYAAALTDGALTLIGVGVCGLVLLAMLALVRRRTDKARAPRPTFAAKLGNSHAVYVVERQGRAWLLGVGPDGPPTLIAEVECTAVLDLVDLRPIVRECPNAPASGFEHHAHERM
jgi:hypothetical protein